MADETAPPDDTPAVPPSGHPDQDRRSVDGEPPKPTSDDIDAWFAAMDRYRDVPFLEHGREQPPMPTERSPFG